MWCRMTDDTTVCNAIAGPLIGDQADDSDVSDLADDEDLCVYCEREPTREDPGEHCSRKCMRKHGAELKRAKHAHSMLKALDTDLMFASRWAGFGGSLGWLWRWLWRWLWGTGRVLAELPVLLELVGARSAPLLCAPVGRSHLAHAWRVAQIRPVACRSSSLT